MQSRLIGELCILKKYDRSANLNTSPMEQFQLTVEPGAIQIPIDPTATILETSLKANVKHAHACGGNARCSSCRVFVLEGMEYLCPRNEKEKKLAGKLGFSDNVRLACQTTVNGNVRVKRPVLDEIDIQIVSSRAADQRITSIGKEMTLSILFADIARYTAFTENAQPYDLVHILNRYYFVMGNAVEKNSGTIIDYYGDGFLSVFGMNEEPDHAKLAVQSGIDMFRRLDDFNEYLKEWLGQSFEIRIGIHTGKVIVGTIGTKSMSKLAVMGDAVNLASRIDSANKELHTKFLVSQSTHELILDHYQTGRDFEVEVKGKKGKHKLFEILTTSSG